MACQLSRCPLPFVPGSWLATSHAGYAWQMRGCASPLVDVHMSPKAGLSKLLAKPTVHPILIFPADRSTSTASVSSSSSASSEAAHPTTDVTSDSATSDATRASEKAAMRHVSQGEDRARDCESCAIVRATCAAR